MQILEEYGRFFIDLFKRFIHMDIIYIGLIVLIIIASNLLLSFTFKKVLERMNMKANKVVWVPFINFLYLIGKSVHSLMAIIFCLLILLIIPIPHPVHGVFTVSSIVSNKMSHVIYLALIIEVIICFAISIYKFIKYEKSIRIVK